MPLLAFPGKGGLLMSTSTWWRLCSVTIPPPVLRPIDGGGVTASAPAAKSQTIFP